MVGLLVAAAVGYLVTLFATKQLISWSRAHEIGQPIHSATTWHESKAGTPTMGGLAVVGGSVLGYVLPHLVRPNVLFTRSGLLLVMAFVGAAAVGFTDDWIKVRHARNLGLGKRAKTAGLLLVTITFTVLALLWTDVHTTISLARFDSPGIELGDLRWGVLAVLVLYGSSNAVNLTDGLDGLATGASTFSAGTFVVIAFWAFRNADIYQIPHAYDLAVFAAALMGSCLGFLWWNSNPADIFLGDTGSLAIGTALAGLALMLGTTLLLPLIGALFVFETISVIIQVAVFRITKGRRVFRMAPIHLHFELGGWPETKVIVRFWILAGVAAALALGIYYADFLDKTG